MYNALIANEKNCVDSETAANNTNDIKDLLLKVQDFVKDFETKIENTLASQTLKVDAMIEVQSIVYSTIKDEKVRNTVANVLTAAKYADTATRLELKREIEALKNEVKEKSHQLSECVKNASDRVEAIVDGERVKSEEVVVRY